MYSAFLDQLIPLDSQFDGKNASALKLIALEHYNLHDQYYERALGTELRAYTAWCLLADKEWGGLPQIQILSRALNVNVIVISTEKTGLEVIRQEHPIGTVCLGHDGAHYHSLSPKESGQTLEKLFTKEIDAASLDFGPPVPLTCAVGAKLCTNTTNSMSQSNSTAAEEPSERAGDNINDIKQTEPSTTSHLSTGAAATMTTSLISSSTSSFWSPSQSARTLSSSSSSDKV